MDHTSDPNAFRYVIDPTRLDLVSEFRSSPLGAHSPELRRMLAKIRWGMPQGRLVLVVLEPGKLWRLARVPAERGAPMPFLDDQTFTSTAAAEWHVFKLRWQELTGVQLPAEFHHDL